ncbi:MAG: hypothetical protein A2Z99_09865 [Treponema sp. GWB1_62_6]|nr:MAG: hypothetical protein A2Z99_09865 [Treponema sp. GWB1_62_6]OHE70123.1 MAG: hypothetical protein A2001_02720 [Treponema sp. GWC1_61_84]OHE70643.1 MAG: hypothetical protein A2413_04430 [Treponema sp. RIFOXYC1_FULL_61_9]HCM25542.1 glycosyl hydrolase family 88 [Treponema sp.]
MNKTPHTALDYGRALARSVSARHSPGSLAWNYETGLVLLALWKLSGAVDDAVLRSWVKASVDALVAEDGAIAGYRSEEFNLDQVNAGKILLELHTAYGDARYLTAASRLRDQLDRQPRTDAGGFWHKKIYPFQMWLDGLYMQAPFAVRWGLEHGDAELVDDVCDQILLAEEKTRENATGLLKHAWDESRKQLWADPVSGRSPHAWARAMGWYGMALVDVLEFLPVGHAKRPSLVAVLDRVAATVVSVRDRESLLWLQVLDQPGRPGNYPETSASAMFCYTLAKGVRIGDLPAEPYRAAAAESFASLASRNATMHKDGGASLAGICKVAGLGGEPYRDGSFSYYIGEPVVTDDFKGVGPFILAAVELG